MFVFIIYAAAVWGLIVRDRRQWRALIWLMLGALGIVVTAWVHSLIAYWSGQQLYLPVLRTILLPFGMLVVGVGAFISILPRTPAYRACRRCRYDMSTLDPVAHDAVEHCPECGTAHAFDHSLLGPCNSCGTTLPLGSTERQECAQCGTIHVERPRIIPIPDVIQRPEPLNTTRVLAPAAKVMRYFASRASAAPKPVGKAQPKHTQRQRHNQQQSQRDQLPILQR